MLLVRQPLYPVKTALKLASLLAVILALALWPVALVGCGKRGTSGLSDVTRTNSAGRVFVRTQEATGRPGEVGAAELWQPVDDRGPDRPKFLRRLAPPGLGLPDEFTRAL